MAEFQAALARRVEALADAGLLRRREPRDAAPAPWSQRGAERLLDFASNDYLGLGRHPAVVEACCAATRRYGAGAGASPYLFGYTGEHAALEQALADFLGRERVLLFPSGYAANLGILDALTERHDLLCQDKLNHASLLDAGRLARARMLRYPHADAAALRRQLASHGTGRRFVASDAVFSMDGDLAPLSALAAEARAASAVLVVDDAHGLGVIGRGGRGTLDEFGLGSVEVPVLVGTLGKALGAAGAFVAGDAWLVEALVQGARTAIYSTATPPGVAAAARTALGLLRSEPALHGGLRANIEYFTAGAAALGLPLRPTPSAIQPIVVGSAERALRLSAALREQGLAVPAIRPPTVPAGTARLRVSLSAAHQAAHIDRLLDALAGLLEGKGASRA